MSSSQVYTPTPALNLCSRGLAVCERVTVKKETYGYASPHACQVGCSCTETATVATAHHHGIPIAIRPTTTVFRSQLLRRLTSTTMTSTRSCISTLPASQQCLGFGGRGSDYNEVGFLPRVARNRDHELPLVTCTMSHPCNRRTGWACCMHGVLRFRAPTYTLAGP